MYKRDFAVVLLSAFAIYYSVQREGPISFRQSWFHELDIDQDLERGHDVLCPPVIADLNGDGRNEVLIATHGTVIHVLSPQYGEQIKGDFADAAKVGEVDLSTNSSAKLTGTHIVALAAGYVDAAPAELVLAQRKQVVVAVTSSWQVFCLDHNLRLLWQAHILDGQAHKHARVREVAIRISAHSLQTKDRGVIVVGGSTEPGDPSDDEDPLNDELAIEEDLARLVKSAAGTDNLQDLDRGSATEGVDASRHFSMYAFEGATGTPRWRHEGTDFHKDTAQLQEQTVPQHNHRLQAEHLAARHYGEASCRDFRQSVLANMPHRWDHRHDTNLDLTHFSRHRGAPATKRDFPRAPGQAGGSPLPRLGGSPGVSSDRAEHHRGVDKRNAVAAALGKASEALAGTEAAANAAEPNVWVAHLMDGIEAVELRSGRTVCKLHLANPGLHVDLDGDGVLDHIQASGGKATDAMRSATGHVHHEKCWAAASSGVPPNQPLFNGSICRYNPLAGMPFGGLGGGSPPLLEVATPAALPISSAGRGDSSPKALAVFLNSRGEVTAYDARGHKHWQNAYGVVWSNLHNQGAGHQVVPTLRAMQLRADPSAPHVVLAAGSHTAVILSPQGHQLELLSLPAAPAIPLQVADFNSDGNNDIILLSRDGVYAFVQVRHIGGLPFTTLIGILLVAMAAVYITQIQPQGKKSGRSKGRSTDRVD